MSEVELVFVQPPDAGLLERVAPDVFDSDPDTAFTREFLSDPRNLLIVALKGEIVVGMVTGIVYIHPDKARQLFVNELGVGKTHRGRGIGGRLLRALLDHAARLGCKEAWVATELSNESARRLYERAGGMEDQEHAVVYTWQLADRPGE